MTKAEAIKECERWFAYLKRERERTVKLQQLAAMARNGQQVEVKRQLNQMDQQPHVYDGARLERAVSILVAAANRQKWHWQGGRRRPRQCD